MKKFFGRVSCVAVLSGVFVLSAGCSCSKPVNAEPETTAALETALLEESIEESTQEVPESLWQVTGVEGDYKNKVTSNTMPLYAEPDDQSEVICEVPGGEEVIFKGEVLIKGESSPFIYVEYDGKMGYAFGEMLAAPILESIEETTEEATTEVEETTEEAGTGVEVKGIEIQEASGTKYATEQVNVRREPSKDGEKIGSLSWSDSVEVTGVTSDGKWYRINLDGQEGFASASYLSDTKPEKQVVSHPDNGGSGAGEAQPSTGGNGGEEAQPDNGGNGDLQASDFMGLPEGVVVDDYDPNQFWDDPDIITGVFDDVVWE